MEIHRINSSVSLGGKRDNIDAFVNLDDNTLREAAYQKAMLTVDNKKYKRQQRIIDASLPLAGGLAAAAGANKGARLMSFAKGTGYWALFLLGIGAAFGLGKFATEHSKGLDDFNKKHPFISFAVMFAGAYAAGKGAIKGGEKLVSVLKNTGAYNKLATKVADGFKSIKAKNTVKKAMEFVSKTPSAIKSVAKVAAQWAPLAVIIGSFNHSLKHANAVNREINSNYNYLKEKQLELSKARTRELEVQNDFLRTNPENENDLKDAKLV